MKQRCGRELSTTFVVVETVLNVDNSSGLRGSSDCSDYEFVLFEYFII